MSSTTPPDTHTASITVRSPNINQERCFASFETFE
jgi:hypothetical protein